MNEAKTLSEVMLALKPLAKQIKEIEQLSTYSKYDDLSELDINIEEADELQLWEELAYCIDKLSTIRKRIEYINKPIKETTKLRLNRNGRYETESGYEYTCGCGIEFLCPGEDDYERSLHEHPYWQTSRVEHKDSGYYIVGHDKLSMDGLLVRDRY